ncbi:MAG: hypothetical protein DHS20C14_08800 [Phycisphaeraceae bacterium]|nr:MAG: hypothetical protein DHS20C14_08800 [Phycisphaeraceae bacterium]
MTDVPSWVLSMTPLLMTLVFVTAAGACVGSLVNVLVYRLPRGEGVVFPSSRCPWCGKVLTWRENIPIFGWLFLRGRCRFCTAPISPEYPIVETVVAGLIGGVFALWFVVPADAVLGLGTLRPEWAENGASQTWPAFVVMAILLGSLTAMTIIDARTFTIPLILTWVPAVVAVVFHTGHAVWQEAAHGAIEQTGTGFWTFADGKVWESAPSGLWTLVTPMPGGWRMIGAAIGGTLGLGVSLVLLRTGLITRSFGDYEAWERAELERMEAEQAGTESVAADALETSTTPPPLTEIAGPSEPDAGLPDDPAMWIRYPHARREMIKELAFLAAPVGLAFAGSHAAVWLVTRFAGAWTFNPTTGGQDPPVDAPLWLTVLAGVLLGYLIGGGVVWAVRIGGSLLFGKEAMGLGDVHLMAAVGACVGWVDATLAFFAAAFVGLGYVLAGGIVLRRMPRAMPYGPFLAIATVLVVVGKVGVEALLGWLAGNPVSLP